ncbi:MAG TPA: hypothetical protein VN540_03190 [Clostridia bacterium]|nr:hypothetical protein [Clostridia bacterium]
MFLVARAQRFHNTSLSAISLEIARVPSVCLDAAFGANLFGYRESGDGQKPRS